MTPEELRKLAADLELGPELHMNIIDAADEIERLTSRVAELEADARRYRWLRENAIGEGCELYGSSWGLRHIPGRHKTFEAAVDAAIESAGGR